MDLPCFVLHSANHKRRLRKFPDQDQVYKHTWILLCPQCLITKTQIWPSSNFRSQWPPITLQGPCHTLTHVNYDLLIAGNPKCHNQLNRIRLTGTKAAICYHPAENWGPLGKSLWRHALEDPRQKKGRKEGRAGRRGVAYSIIVPR